VLNVFRKNIKIIIWIIAFSLVGWGVGTMSITSDDKTLYAGSINGKNVSHQEFLSTLRLYELLLAGQTVTPEVGASDESGEAPPATPQPMPYEAIRGVTWQTLVLEREAKRQKLTVNDEEVRAEVIRMFTSPSGFSEAFYNTWVSQNFKGRARDFEEAVRRHLAAQKLRVHAMSEVPEESREEFWRTRMMTILTSSQLEDFNPPPPPPTAPTPPALPAAPTPPAPPAS
jgi:hypothetical protein